MSVAEQKTNLVESVVIPPPLLVVIEDVGWWSGFSRPELNQPFRTGMERIHCPEDYEALIRLAKALKTQIIAGFVLCEWDRTGILKELPSATWLGSKWKGCTDGMEFQEKAVSILNKNPESISIAMHGVGHEYWNKGSAERSEFHDENCVMRDKDQVVKHIEMFEKLLRTTGINTSFPKIFIPPALKHSFGNGENGFQKILADFGTSHVITVFDKAKQFAPPIFKYVTKDCEVTLLERGLAPVSWDNVSAKPVFSFYHPIIPLHWANILHPDPDKNMDVVDAWAEFLTEGARLNGYIFFPDALAAMSQIIFHKLTRLQPMKGGIILDISDPRHMLSKQSPFSLYLKLPPEARLNKKDGTLNSASHIKEGLMQLTPSPEADHIHIFFDSH